MARLLLILSFFITTSVFAQRDSIINGRKCHLYLDNDTGTAWIQKVVVKKSGKQFNGAYFEFYRSGKLKVKGYFKSGERSDEWNGFYEDGNKKFQGFYEDGYKSDLWMEYFDAGVMSWKGSFFKDMRAGFWRYYYENGKLKMMTRYEIKTIVEKGDPVVKSKGSSFKVNRKISYTISPCDSLVEYYQDGTLKVRILYGHHGGLNGKCEYFYANGKKNFEGMYIDGKESGTWNWYCVDGKISKFMEHTENEPPLMNIGHAGEVPDCIYVEIKPEMLWLPEKI